MRGSAPDGSISKATASIDAIDGAAKSGAGRCRTLSAGAADGGALATSSVDASPTDADAWLSVAVHGRACPTSARTAATSARRPASSERTATASARAAALPLH